MNEREIRRLAAKTGLSQHETEELVRVTNLINASPLREDDFIGVFTIDPIDYRELLKKYMANIINYEGSNFLADTGLAEKCSNDEWDEINRIAKDAEDER